MGHKGKISLLKAVLAKSTAVMAGQTSQTKYPAMYVYGLINQYCRINFIFNVRYSSLDDNNIIDAQNK